MTEAGVFITLYDESTLRLYLARGTYGFLMQPVGEVISSRSRHFHALADYSALRSGTHVFFFLKRTIVYGGQILGPEGSAAFYLNGPLSPLGRLANAPLVWDESNRERYRATSQPGVFEVPDVGVRCQPYIIRFEDLVGLHGAAISSDDLYWRVGSFPYPLPSNSIQGMSFCLLSPGETSIAIEQLHASRRRPYDPSTSELIAFSADPLAFDARLGPSSLAHAFRNSYFVNEAHLEASILANPTLLPHGVRPGPGDALCRQVPISPFKPFQMDRADICYFEHARPINSGTVPNTIVELKARMATTQNVKQVERYLAWLSRVVDSAVVSSIKAYLVAPSFARGVAPTEFASQIELIEP